MDPIVTKRQYQSITEYVERLNDETSIRVARFLRENPSSRIGWRDIIFSPVATFFRSWISRKGYRDGVRAFTASVLEGLSVLAFYSKVWEYHYRREERRGILPPITDAQMGEQRKTDL